MNNDVSQHKKRLKSVDQLDVVIRIHDEQAADAAEPDLMQQPPVQVCQALLSQYLAWYGPQSRLTGGSDAGQFAMYMRRRTVSNG
jgi:hypothetical protein